ncbi:hypothetical protein EG68_05865 [Paragonimus skrjabini miyazakii]|uniref:Glycosyltransferase n=1 Tax=Paragonimus skrjabini miyazakii TaxID=59628 RepID=A0A8S9YT56_9TREM|nr:hypothetical protein EG68_05865 [Paragonimus skrjabini miyazakii]
MFRFIRIHRFISSVIIFALSVIPRKYGSITVLPECVYKCNETDSIHIVATLHGLNSTYNLLTMLKSLTYFRGTFRCVCPDLNGYHLSVRNPISLHLIMSESTKNIFHEIVYGWAKNIVNFHVYSAESYTSSMKRIPNRHPAGVWGMVKLMVPEIVPQSVEKVIILDTDTIFNADVEELWSHFSRFDEYQSIGMAFEQNPEDAHCADWHNPFMPEKGVNGGVVLVDLVKLRKINWHQIWREVVVNYFKTVPELAEGEQTIVHAILQMIPQLYYKLPCEWNVQVWNAKAAACCPVVWPHLPGELTNEYDDVVSVKLLHYNSKIKPHFLDPKPKWRPQLARSQPALTVEELRIRAAEAYHIFREQSTL